MKKLRVIITYLLIVVLVAGLFADVQQPAEAFVIADDIMILLALIGVGGGVVWATTTDMQRSLNQFAIEKPGIIDTLQSLYDSGAAYVDREYGTLTFKEVFGFDMSSIKDAIANTWDSVMDFFSVGSSTEVGTIVLETYDNSCVGYDSGGNVVKYNPKWDITANGFFSNPSVYDVNDIVIVEVGSYYYKYFIDSVTYKLCLNVLYSKDGPTLARTSDFGFKDWSGFVENGSMEGVKWGFFLVTLSGVQYLGVIRGGSYNGLPSVSYSIEVPNNLIPFSALSEIKPYEDSITYGQTGTFNPPEVKEQVIERVGNPDLPWAIPGALPDALNPSISISIPVTQEQVLEGIQNPAIPADPSIPWDGEGINWGRFGDIVLFDVFPFSLPKDAYLIVEALSATPKEPSFEFVIIPASVASKFNMKEAKITLDFKQFESVRKIVRNCLLVLFIIGMLYMTKQYIWTGGG